VLKNGARFRYTRSRDYQTPTRHALLGSGSSWKTHLKLYTSTDQQRVAIWRMKSNYVCRYLKYVQFVTAERDVSRDVKMVHLLWRLVHLLAVSIVPVYQWWVNQKSDLQSKNLLSHALTQIPSKLWSWNTSYSCYISCLIHANVLFGDNMYFDNVT